MLFSSFSFHFLTCSDNMTMLSLLISENFGVSLDHFDILLDVCTGNMFSSAFCVSGYCWDKLRAAQLARLIYDAFFAHDFSVDFCLKIPVFDYSNLLISGV